MKGVIMLWKIEKQISGHGLPSGGQYWYQTKLVFLHSAEVTNSLPYFNYVAEKGIPQSKIVELDKAVQARYARLTITELNNDGSPDASPIAIYMYVIFRCCPSNVCISTSRIYQGV